MISIQTPDAIADQLVKLASKCFGRPEAEISRDVPLQEQGADSLGFADFVFDVEDSFGVDITGQPEVAGTLKTIAELADYIAARKSPASPA